MDTDSMILEILGDFPECDRPEEAELSRVHRKMGLLLDVATRPREGRI